MLGARGPCGQRVRLAAALGLGRGSDLATALPQNMAVSLVAAQINKLEIVVTGRVQVKIFRNIALCFENCLVFARLQKAIINHNQWMNTFYGK